MRVWINIKTQSLVVFKSEIILLSRLITFTLQL